MTPEERASSLANSGLSSSAKQGSANVDSKVKVSLSDSDEEEDDTSYGIIPKSKLIKSDDKEH